jgi:hypothetical protein
VRNTVCLQEWAVKVFKRKYISGDPAKFRDYEGAEEALTEVRWSAQRAVFHTLILCTEEFVASRNALQVKQVCACCLDLWVPWSCLLTSVNHTASGAPSCCCRQAGKMWNQLHALS